MAHFFSRILPLLLQIRSLDHGIPARHRSSVYYHIWRFPGPSEMGSAGLCLFISFDQQPALLFSGVREHPACPHSFGVVSGAFPGITP